MLPAVVAVIFALVSALGLFVPFVARTHRRRGELCAREALVRFAFLVHVMALAAYVLLPLPSAQSVCEVFADVHPQLEPLTWLRGTTRLWELPAALLADTPAQQFALNVLLFIPLGAFCRSLFGLRTATATAVGGGISLLVEITQLTGVWFTYPCPYRWFDVDDLIANTCGAFLGAVLARAVRMTSLSSADPARPRRVTAERRLLGMCCDVVVLWWLGTIFLRVTDFSLDAGSLPAGWRAPVEAAVLWFAPAALTLLITGLGGGNTLGQHAVLLRTTPSPGKGPLLARWLAGLGGLAILEGTLRIAGWATLAVPAGMLWCAAHAFGVTWTADHRGISGRLAKLRVVDQRAPGPAAPAHR